MTSDDREHTSHPYRDGATAPFDRLCRIEAMLEAVLELLYDPYANKTEYPITQADVQRAAERMTEDLPQ